MVPPRSVSRTWTLTRMMTCLMQVDKPGLIHHGAGLGKLRKCSEVVLENDHAIVLGHVTLKDAQDVCSRKNV